MYTTLSSFKLTPPPPPAATISTTTTTDGIRTTAVIPLDVLQFHILIWLNGPTLAAASCVSSHFHMLSARPSLWADICRSTWPLTDDPQLREAIAAFPGSHRSFFSNSYPLPAPAAGKSVSQGSPEKIISAVDIHHRGRLILSRVVETETISGWFHCSPFRVDMLEPKDVVPTRMPYPATDNECRQLSDDLELSWIVFDPTAQRSMNVSSRWPVSVSRHWLSGEVHARFATVLAGEKRGSEFVRCGVVVTCGGVARGGEMHVTEVSMQVEDMDGVFLNGRDSLVILRRGLEGKRGKAVEGVGEEGKRMNEEFMRMKMERMERKVKMERTLDMICLGFGLFLIIIFIIWIIICAII